MNDKKQPLFLRNFTLVVIGQIISLFGNAILRFALPLYLLRETGSSSLFGAVTACSFIPMILLSLAGGVFADRMNKRNIMVILDFSTALLITVFYLMLGKLPVVPLMIVCLMALYGISGAYQPAVQASIPLLVQPGQIMQANAVINMVSTLAGLLGPVIGGILFGTWGLFPILSISILCFISSAVMEIFIRIPHEKRETEAGIFSVVKSDLKESFLYIRNEKPVLLSVVSVLALFNLVLSAAMIVGIPVIIVNILKMSDAALGITQGALGFGGLAGGVLGGIFSERLKLRNCHLLLALCSFAAACMGVSLLPLFTPMTGYLTITVMSFIAMAASTIFLIQICSAVQLQSPPHLLGKIMAALMAVSGCSQPLGQALYGILFDRFADASFLVLFGSAAVSLIISFYSRTIFLKLDLDENSRRGAFQPNLIKTEKN